MAKALKQDIDKLRAAGEAAATGHIGEVPKARRATDPEEIFNRVLGRCVLSAAPQSLRNDTTLFCSSSSLMQPWSRCRDAAHMHRCQQ